MLFAKVPHYLADELPTDRPYTRLEAAFQYDMDQFISKERSDREYSRMWQWGRDKVARFINEMRSKSDEDSLSFAIKNDQPNTSQKPAKDQPPKPFKNSTLQDTTSQTPASDQPNTSQLYIRENKREESPSLSELWNEVVSGSPLSSVRVPISNARLKKCAARLKERPLSEWREVFRLMMASPFLRGEIKDFKADFDWIISNGSNAEKVLEGKYQNAGSRVATSDNRYGMFAGA